MVRTCERSHLAQIILQNWDSPLFSQLMEIGREMELLYKKISRGKPTSMQMIRALVLPAHYEICLLYFLRGKTNAIEFENLTTLFEE